ncbi:ABC transporter ATP-binding protein [Ohtaekwangia sp.]|uniref:ABC transporter ATP-binding protein n=1 Tax=Ohtaekwangia sp. TaxID=2066019 RepID=UPI002FDD3BE0
MSHAAIHTEQIHQARFTVQVSDLGKRFNREWIFRNLNYTFQAGQTYAITGANGSGKSTLLQVIWGQMPPSKGTVKYITEGVETTAESVFQRIAIATPYMDLIDEFTLQEQLDFHFKLRSPRYNLKTSEMIERMYLTAARDKYISNFSSGMRQRVKLALAFYTEADMVFLDEPGTNLDQRAFDWYLHELHQLPAHTTIFIASNQPAEYPASAHKIDIMQFK